MKLWTYKLLRPIEKKNSIFFILYLNWLNTSKNFTKTPTPDWQHWHIYTHTFCTHFRHGTPKTKKVSSLRYHFWMKTHFIGWHDVTRYPVTLYNYSSTHDFAVFANILTERNTDGLSTNTQTYPHAYTVRPLYLYSNCKTH